MTINKSQGQTLKKRVGVYLPEPVVAHGQLYVAASHVSHPGNIQFAFTGSTTQNIVYAEILRDR